jgi:hypothetical protein
MLTYADGSLFRHVSDICQVCSRMLTDADVC